MTVLWERSDDGTTWQRWMDITFQRIERSRIPLERLFQGRRGNELWHAAHLVDERVA
jgi:hypothetical protein